MIERYQPELWIHGHMHDPVDERLGRTRLTANPAGYRHENKRGFDPGLCVDLDEAVERDEDAGLFMAGVRGPGCRKPD